MVDIQAEIQEYFSKDECFHFWDELAKREKLWKDLIPKEDFRDKMNIWFTADENGIVWLNDTATLEPFKRDGGQEGYTFICDFKVSGLLHYYYLNTLEENHIPHTYNLTLGVDVFSPDHKIFPEYIAF